jgi:hypothetical protein
LELAGVIGFCPFYPSLPTAVNLVLICLDFTRAFQDDREVVQVDKG